MIPGARLVLLGRQGAGKGTQCTRLARHYLVPHISTGDMLRGAVREGTEFGRKAKEYMDAGDLLPDDIITGVVDERLEHDDTRKRGFVLDGFPRTVGQAQALEEIAAPKGIDLVVNLDVPIDVVLARLASRRVCVDCGTNYTAADAPDSAGGQGGPAGTAMRRRPKGHVAAWSCEVCGGKVIHRAHDTVEAIQRRLDLYEEETAPLIAWYDERGLMVSVDGTGATGEVTDRLIAAIVRRRR